MKSLLLYCFCFFISLNAIAQKVMVKGLVTSQNEPVENITVKILGSNGSTKSNGSGTYQLSGITSGNYDLIFSGIGYQSKRIKVMLKEIRHWLTQIC